MELNAEQIEFLNECTKFFPLARWTLNSKTGLVDIDGSFDCSNKKLKDFKGVKFGMVVVDFNCDNNELTSLEGAPQKIGGDFYCANNKLTRLGGAPQKIGGSFICSNNKLTSLGGAPQEVGGGFGCRGNELTSLEGAPQEVGGSFNCSNNELTSLEGAPQEVGGSFNCSNNKLTSLGGAPQKVGGDFYCANNNFPIPNCILDLVIETMKDKRVNYYTALLLNKEKLDKEKNKIIEKLEKLENIFSEIDTHVTKEEQKSISILSRLGYFNRNHFFI